MTTFTGDNVTKFQAASIKGMLKLRLLGMKGRGRVSDILATAHSITGQGPYKTSKAQQQKAVDDLQAWINERSE